jgi:hypothetical protein
MNTHPEDDFSYLDLLHQRREQMASRAVELQERCKQIIAETDDPKKREWVIRLLKFYQRVESHTPKTL